MQSWRTKLLRESLIILIFLVLGVAIDLRCDGLGLAEAFFD